ncbi:MAG: hypothetical protein U9N46_03630 [Euryarchaeota archaeon]|nr:hypothetical protein [Euryarchaeota archaeon]
MREVVKLLGEDGVIRRRRGPKDTGNIATFLILMDFPTFAPLRPRVFAFL